MDRTSEKKIVLIRRRTRLEELVSRYNTLEQARFYIEHLGSDFTDYVKEDETYKSVLSSATAALSGAGRLHVVDREYLPNYIFGREDTVVAVGQDGLVANTLKYLQGQPLIGVNPDPGRWDGVLLPFTAADLPALMKDVFAGKRPLKEVTMAMASLNDGQRLYAVNDLFIGRRTHVSSRYNIRHGDFCEDQSSSGIIVSTALGSTGWLKSILAGAQKVVEYLGGDDTPHAPPAPPPWDADYLQFTVREPFPSRASRATVVTGRITASMPMRIVSQMPESGVIFSDGIESDFLEFRSGVVAAITVADKKGYLVR